jgi:hypothetical protein
MALTVGWLLSQVDLRLTLVAPTKSSPGWPPSRRTRCLHSAALWPSPLDQQGADHRGFRR